MVVSVPVLLVGKTAVVEAISEVLAERSVPHAAVDLDARIWHWPVTSRWHDDLLFAPRDPRRRILGARERALRALQAWMLQEIDSADEVGQVLQRVVEVVPLERRELEVLAHVGRDR